MNIHTLDGIFNFFHDERPEILSCLLEKWRRLLTFRGRIAAFLGQFLMQTNADFSFLYVN